MVTLSLLTLSFLNLKTCVSTSCTDEKIYYSQSINSSDLVPAFSSITCPTTYLYLTNGDFSLSTAQTINLNLIATSYLEILPLYCELNQSSNCYLLGTRPTIQLTDSIVTFTITGTVVIRDIVFSHKFNFKPGCSVCDYCRVINNTNGNYYNDRGEAIGDDEYLSQTVCDQYTSLNFISVEESANLSLYRVAFNDFRTQFSSLIYIDRAEVLLSDVDFYNIVVKSSVIDSQSEDNRYSTSFNWTGGGVQLLNNGYEFDSILGSSSFLTLSNFFRVYIRNLDVKNNIGANLSLIDLINIYELRFWSCNFTYNILKEHLINIDQKKISWYEYEDTSLYTHIVDIYDVILSNNYAEHIINFMFDLDFQRVFIEDMELVKNSALVAIYYTSNFQDISKPMNNFEYFIIFKTKFELNYIGSLIKVYSVPVVYMRQMIVQNNGLAFDVETEILDKIANEGEVYFKNSRSFDERIVECFIYLSISIYSVVDYSDFYYNTGQLFNLKQAFRVYFKYVQFENNYNEEEAFIIVDDFYELQIDNFKSTNNTSLKQEAYFMNFNGLNYENILSLTNIAFVNCNIGIYISYGGKIQLENISILGSKASSSPLIDIKIERPSSFSLKNSLFTNNINDILHINPAFGQVLLNFSIENTNFTDCKPASKLINIGSQLQISSASQNLIKDCEFSNNTGNIFTIESSQDEIFFENCVFLGNSASDTGVISGFTTTTINFINTQFTQNSMVLLNFNLKPNSIKTFDCLFDSNTGIVVQSLISHYYDHGSLYTSNQASILKIQSGGSATLDSSVIESNTVSTKDSLFEILSGSRLLMSNVTVYNNTSVQKALVFIEDDSGASIRDSVFESNSAYRGSALLVQHCILNRVDLSNVRFLNNNAEVSGTIFVLEGYLTVESSEFSNNKATHSAGIDVTYSSLVLISDTKFSNQAGQGSCIKSQDSSKVSVSSSEFSGFFTDVYGTLIEVKDSELALENSEFRNVEFFEGYLILGENSYFLFRLIYSSGTVFSNIKMNKNSYLLYFDKSSEIEMVNATIESFTGSGIFVGGKSTLHLISSSIRDGISESGTGVFCKSCRLVKIASSEFKHLHANGKGGCIYLSTNQIEHNNTISFSDFHECVSVAGGALYLANSAMVITSCKFSSSQAIFPGQGGAIFQEPSNQDPIFLISQSSFSNNSASISGGAIQWYSSLPTIQDSTFNNNSAYYGPDLASFSCQFNLSGSRALSQVVFAPGQQRLTPLKILALDHYDQLVITDNLTTAELSFPNEDVFIKGSTQLTATMGELTVTDITIYGEPGFKPSMHVSFESFLGYMPKIDLSIKIELRGCVSGEVLVNNNSCEVCKPGTYNLIPATECLQCPTGGRCRGGNRIYTEDGYWRTSEGTDTIFVCPNELACFSDENEQKCGSGYKGNLCQACSVGYSRSAENTCAECLDSTKNTLRITGVLLSIALFLAFQTFSSINSAYKEQSINSIYLKILINYFQLVALTISFDLDWPNLAMEMFKIQGYTSSGSEQFLSFDCLVEENYEPYYLRLLIFPALPALSFLMTVITWNLISCCRKTENVREKIFGSIVLQLFFFHPMLVKLNFSIFNCRELLPGEFYLRSDMDIQCWEGDHLIYALAVAVPSICIYCIGLPFLFFLRLFKSRGSLDKISEKLKFNFLYKGYLPKYYYWEAVVILRKLLIIGIFVFLSHAKLLVQALCTFIVILASFLLQYKSAPFTHPSLNTLELQSITISAVTIYSGFYFLSNSLDNTSKLVVFGFMVLSNLLFISTWLYLTFSFICSKLCSRCSLFRRIFRKWGNDQSITAVSPYTTPDLVNLPITDLKKVNSMEFSRVLPTGWIPSTPH